LKIPITKRAGGVAQGEYPEFKPQYHQKKKKKKRGRQGKIRSSFLGHREMSAKPSGPQENSAF
jgi:hypothetical protein